jgi:hypothetical protein
MNSISIILEIVGLVLLVIGYQRSKRNIMLAGAILLWFGGSLGDFARGFIDGIRGH